jgi:hypothetical protein
MLVRASRSRVVSDQGLHWICRSRYSVLSHVRIFGTVEPLQLPRGILDADKEYWPRGTRISETLDEGTGFISNTWSTLEQGGSLLIIREELLSVRASFTTARLPGRRSALAAGKTRGAQSLLTLDRHLCSI